MALADGFVLEDLPFAGAVEVRRESSAGDQKDQSGDREEEGCGRGRGLTELEAAQHRGDPVEHQGSDRGSFVDAGKAAVFPIDIPVLDDRGHSGDADDDEGRHDQPLRGDDERARVARAPAEPGHQIDERDGGAEPDRDERKRRARREAQTAAFEELLHGALMLAGRRTLRWGGESAPGLTVVTAAGLPEHHTKPEVARRDDDPAGQWDLALGEVPDRPGEAAVAVMVMHVRTIAVMPDDAKGVSTRHSELTLEEIAELLPGTGEIMASVGECWWKCAYAARGGNWPLAAYFVRRVRSLQRKLAVVRPKYAGDLAAFEDEHIDPALAACDAADQKAFDRAFAAATDKANELHVKWAKPYIRWTLPDEPPKDLEMSGQP